MFSKFFINRPVFASVISIIIVIAGFMGIKSLPVEEYPRLTPPMIVVSAYYNGADSETIANTVAAPIEDAINGVENMIYMQSSSSSSGAVSVNVYFKIGTNPMDAKINVNNRVSSILSKLPEEVRRIGVNVEERSASILEVVSFTSPDGSMDDIEMNNYVALNVADELKRVSGVGNVSVIGGKDYSARVWLKPDVLSKFNLTPSEVIAAIREQNSQYAVGRLGQEPLSKNVPYVYSIKTEGRLKNIEEFKNIILRSDENGAVLRLKDVANVELGANNYDFTGELNSHSMIPVMIFLQSNANAIETAQLIQEKLEELSKRFPPGLEYSIPYDTTKFVKISIKEVVKTFIEAMILVMLVIYMFLKNFRATIIPIIAVPVSIIGTFGALYVMGFSINLITLFALVLAIGIVVDDAIIVIENVERNLREDKNITPKEATVKAMSEVGAPIISIVLVLSAVFIPVSFMEGFVGQIQKQFALTLVISVCISGFVALTLTPALCAVFLKNHELKPFWFVRKFNDFFDWSTKIFTAGVSQILRHIIPSLLVVGIMGYAIFALFQKVPHSLVPNEDKGILLAITSLPPASTLHRTIEEVDKISTIARSNNNIQNVASLNGYDIVSGTLRESSAVMFIELKDWDKRLGVENSSFSIASKLNQMFFMDKQSQTFVLNPPPINGLSITGGFDMFVQNRSGKSYNEIQKDIFKLIIAANQRPELTFVRTTLETNYPQYDLIVNKEKVKMLGVSMKTIFDTLAATIGTYYVNDFNMFGKAYKVNVRAQSEFRSHPEDISNIFVKSNSGKMIPIDSLITLKRSVGPDNVDRFNQFAAAKVMGQPKPGYTSGDAIRAIQEVAQEVLPDDYSIAWSGSAYQEVNTTGTGTTAFIFGMVFVFLILAAQYERWLMPLAVITAVPFAVLGSLVAVWMRGLNNDVYFQIGLLLLIGLSAKNAILIVEFAMSEHLKGKPIFDASILAAKLRFRPIVMTSLAFTLGVLPMVLSTGAGSASRHALGTGVIGGMIAATTIAIFFIPMFFYLLESFNEWLDKKLGRKIENKEI